MYNKYMQSDSDTFSELFERVESTCEEKITERAEPHSLKGFSVNKLLKGLDIDKFGLLPLVLLLLLLVDVDDEEKLIIIILAVIFGI